MSPLCNKTAKAGGSHLFLDEASQLWCDLDCELWGKYVLSLLLALTLGIHHSCKSALVLCEESTFATIDF